MKKEETPRAQRIAEPERTQEDREDVEIIIRTINVIVGGVTRGGTTKLAYKKHLQEVLSLSTTMMKKACKLSPILEIIFSSSDHSQP